MVMDGDGLHVSHILENAMSHDTSLAMSHISLDVVRSHLKCKEYPYHPTNFPHKFIKYYVICQFFFFFSKKDLLLCIF